MSTRIDLLCNTTPEPCICANIVIQNCCEPSIFNIITVDTPNLPLSGTFSDDEGNCWSIYGISYDPIDSIRIVDSIYGTCELCIEVNQCPDNLILQSCCDAFSETVITGTIPGLSIGSVFLDTYGFCWEVVNIFRGPIESYYTVDPPLINDCNTCIQLEDSCPEIVELISCCIVEANINRLFTTLNLIGNGVVISDIFRDQFGYCWTIHFIPTPVIVNTAFIQANEIIIDCTECPIPDLCYEQVIYKLKNCLLGTIEYASFNFGYYVGDVLQIITSIDDEKTCYEILSWDTTSIPTMTITSLLLVHEDCITCITP
jgi:hypothetical protein